MLFNSAGFLFVFLPITAAVGLWLQRRDRRAFIVWMILASLVFYGSWHPTTLWVLCASLVINFGLARAMENAAGGIRRMWLVAGLAWNLGLLGYFKYTNFLADVIEDLAGSDPGWATVILPVGISFFTFQKIAFLVDIYTGPDRAPGFARFSLFVLFFPQLIAGPIVHHRELVPQLDRPNDRRLENLALGLTILVIGLIKKLYIADGASIPADAVFQEAANGMEPGFLDAWSGALAYTIQIYFDFSAYSDMAIGLARIFGIDLPINFASPYKARSIVDFWRRWHVTLSRFLRDYLYIPLGGNRRGPLRQEVNLFLTMLLGGIWHGAGFTFVLWGALHGIYLLVAHRFARSGLGRSARGTRLWPVLSWTLTMICVIVAWVPFRAPDLATTFAMWRGMADVASLSREPLMIDDSMMIMVFSGVVIAVFLPNLYELFARFRLGLASPGYPATEVRAVPYLGVSTLTTARGALLGIGVAAVVLKLNDVSAFIYFQF